MKKLILLVIFALMSFTAFSASNIQSTQPVIKTLELQVITGDTAKSSAFVTTTVATTSVDASTDTLTAASHPFETGDKIRVTSTASIPDGLDDDTDYYIIDKTSNTFQLATTRAISYTGTPIVDITTVGTGTHTFQLNEIKITNHKFNDNDRVQITTAGSLPTGLALSTDYWVQKINANLFNLRAAYDDASPVEWTDVETESAGSGAFTITKTEDFSGLAKFQATITASETGIFKIDFNESYGSDANVMALITPTEDECHAWLKSKDASGIVVQTDNATDGTTPKDCNFNALVIGSLRSGQN